ncbi:MAG: hypothetical protein ACTSRP_04840 [Candidatus Helarchaeota archaeon]
MERKYILMTIELFITIMLFVSIIVLGLLEKFTHEFRLIPVEYSKFFINILPGSIYTDMIFLFGLPILFFFIYCLIFPYISRILVFFHKLWRRKSKYCFIEVGEKITFYKLFVRAFYMGLFSFSITTLISSFSGYHLFRAGTPIPGREVLFICEDIFLGTFLITPITIILFFPLFQLEDSGFIAYRHLPEFRRTPEIEGVHAIFYRLLKGYAGLSTIITLVYYIYNSFEAVNWNFKEPAILTPLILIMLPFLVSGLLYIPFLLNEKYIHKNTKKLHNAFKKLNLVIIPTFEELTKK